MNFIENLLLSFCYWLWYYGLYGKYIIYFLNNYNINNINCFNILLYYRSALFIFPGTFIFVFYFTKRYFQ